ncbi:MAG: phage portal protein family protein [Methylovulum sp.]
MFDVLKKAGKKLLGTEIASRTSDPNFYGVLQFLPNPDTILRKMGKSQEVFDAIVADAHVIGELRPMRANIIAHKWRILPGGDRLEDLRAFELAQKVYRQRPAPGMGWPDVFWTMQEAVLRGQRIHEVVWELVDGLQVPVQVLDRPNHRFIYGIENELRLLNQENRVVGVPVDPYKFLVSRHMPSYDNPYGVALLSSCFWPYTFKHNGFRYFTKFCEKYGIPWAVGKYPAGTAQTQIDALADGLARMVEDAIAAIPDSGKVELIESNSSSKQLPQERLIQVCNAEMSKCLSSQTLATEINGQGSFAAAQTHREREQENGAADRKIVEASNNQLLAWLTELNFAGAAQPRFEFYRESEARKDWIDVFSVTRDFLDVPVKFAHERLQIPMPQKDEAVLQRSARKVPLKQSDFARQPTKYLEQWIEIFRGGVSDGGGQRHQFTVEELDEVIANFDPNNPPPYVIGQPKATVPDQVSVYGWVQALRRDGLNLWARGTQVEPQFDNLIKGGRYQKQAVRIMPTSSGWTLIRVSFIGVVPPVTQGLTGHREIYPSEITGWYGFYL